MSPRATSRSFFQIRAASAALARGARFPSEFTQSTRLSRARIRMMWVFESGSPSQSFEKQTMSRPRALHGYKVGARSGRATVRKGPASRGRPRTPWGPGRSPLTPPPAPGMARRSGRGAAAAPSAAASAPLPGHGPRQAQRREDALEVAGRERGAVTARAERGVLPDHLPPERDGIAAADVLAILGRDRGLEAASATARRTAGLW